MARKPEMRGAFAADRDHVLGRAIGRIAHHPAVDGEAEGFQRPFEDVEHLACRRRDAGAPNQLGGKLDGIDRHGQALASIRRQASRAASSNRGLHKRYKCSTLQM
jgi:hypothetical protein